MAVLKTWVVCGCFAEAAGNQRGRHSHLELAWPLRKKRRKRHHDSCPHDWQEDQRHSRAYRGREGNCFPALRIPRCVRVRQIIS